MEYMEYGSLHNYLMKEFKNLKWTDKIRFLLSSGNNIIMLFPLSLGYFPSGVTYVLHLPRHSSDERFAFASSKMRHVVPNCYPIWKREDEARSAESLSYLVTRG